MSSISQVNSSLHDDSGDKLRERIRLLLNGVLGAQPITSTSEFTSKPKSSILRGFCWGVGYAIVFCALPWFLFKHSCRLLWLSVWGGCYFAFAAAIAGLTSSRVLRVIEDSILPELSDRAAAAINKDLTRQFDNKRISIVSFFVALFAAAISALALHHNVESASFLEIGWACCGLFILYLTAARATDVARFYGAFSTNLKIDRDRVYALDPAHSSQVVHIASLGRSVLLFWFGIVCSVVTLIPLFKDLSWFVMFVVPTASFFSLGFGTIVFLNSERDIHSVVDGVAASTLRSVEHEISDLFNRRRALDAVEWKQLQDLMSLHEKIVSTGLYRSTLLSGLSILVPFIGPAVTVLSNWKKLKL